MYVSVSVCESVCERVYVSVSVCVGIHYASFMTTALFGTSLSLVGIQTLFSVATRWPPKLLMSS